MAGATGVASLISTRRWIDWSDTGRDLAWIGLDRHEPTSGPTHQPHALRLYVTYDRYHPLPPLSYLILQPLCLQSRSFAHLSISQELMNRCGGLTLSRSPSGSRDIHLDYLSSLSWLDHWRRRECDIDFSFSFGINDWDTLRRSRDEWLDRGGIVR